MRTLPSLVKKAGDCPGRWFKTRHYWIAFSPILWNLPRGARGVDYCEYCGLRRVVSGSRIFGYFKEEVP